MTTAPTAEPTDEPAEEPADEPTTAATPSGAPATGAGGTAQGDNIPLALGGLAALLAAGAVAGSATRRRRSHG